VAKTTPKPEPAVATVPATEAKTKAVAGEEKVQPVAKQVPVVTAKATVPAPAAKPEKAAAQEYIVKPGDTLARLAEQFYSSANKWSKIYEANKDQVKNPNYIFIGMKLTIPADDKRS
jgi:nucleoid-associated protein YgaU